MRPRCVCVCLRVSASFSPVTVADGLMTSDGQLKATQSPVAVFSNSTQQWHVALACGNFTYHHQPPFDVLWKVGLLT